MTDELQIEVAPVSSDVRIGSVIELENHESYEVESVYEESSYKGNLVLELVPSTRKAGMKLSYGQVVNSYGVVRRVCAVRMSGWNRPHVELKEVDA